MEKKFLKGFKFIIKILILIITTFLILNYYRLLNIDHFIVKNFLKMKISKNKIKNINLKRRND